MSGQGREQKEREVRQLYNFVAEQVIAGLYKSDIIEKLIELGVDQYTASELVAEMEARLKNMMNKRVLAVVRDGRLLNPLVKHLKASGYKADSVATQAEVNRAVREIVPDLVIVEHHPGRLDGLAVLKDLRSSPIGRKLPAFVICNRKAMQDAFAAFHFVDCLVRPVSAAEITARVKKILLVPERFWA